MRKGVLAIAAAFIAASAMPTVSIAKGHDEPGEPGSPNCHGQTMAYFNQLGAEIGIHGIGNLAEESDLSVQEVQALVDEYCNPPPDDGG